MSKAISAPQPGADILCPTIKFNITCIAVVSTTVNIYDIPEGSDCVSSTLFQNWQNITSNNRFQKKMAKINSM